MQKIFSGKVAPLKISFATIVGVCFIINIGKWKELEQQSIVLLGKGQLMRQLLDKVLVFLKDEATVKLVIGYRR